MNFKKNLLLFIILVLVLITIILLIKIIFYNKNYTIEKYFDSNPPDTAPSDTAPSNTTLSNTCEKDSTRWTFCNNALKKLGPNELAPDEWWSEGQGCYKCPKVLVGETLEGKIPLPDTCEKNNARWNACNQKITALSTQWDENLWNPEQICNNCPKTDRQFQSLEDVANLPLNNRTHGQSCRLDSQCENISKCRSNICIENSKYQKKKCNEQCAFTDECGQVKNRSNQLVNGICSMGKTCNSGFAIGNYCSIR